MELIENMEVRVFVTWCELVMSFEYETANEYLFECFVRLFWVIEISVMDLVCSIAEIYTC